MWIWILKEFSNLPQRNVLGVSIADELVELPVELLVEVIHIAVELLVDCSVEEIRRLLDRLQTMVFCRGRGVVQDGIGTVLENANRFSYWKDEYSKDSEKKL